MFDFMDNKKFKDVQRYAWPRNDKLEDTDIYIYILRLGNEGYRDKL